MTSPIVRKKNQVKHAAWQNMTTEELVSMLGKRGRAKAIRAILRKRIQAMNLLLPDDQKITERPINKGMSLYP